MSDPTQTIPTGSRGGSARRGADPRDERIQTLDPTPATPQADPGEMRAGPVGIGGEAGRHQVLRPSSAEIGSALRDGPEPPEAEKPKVQYFRYVGDKPRKFKQQTGGDGYTATMQPGKVISTKDYVLAQLKSQGFLPGRNLEEISEEEAKAS